MGYFYGQRPLSNRPRRKKGDLKRLILLSFNGRRRTTSEISRIAKVGRQVALNQIEELKALRMVEETITTPSTRIFKLSDIGEEFTAKLE